jgi:tRNA threonylcarbamoyladenosine biosynthesis protein TsaB
MILTIRTDKPEAEVGLYNDQQELVYKTWQAHRELGSTIHANLKSLLDSQKLDWSDVTGIVYYHGPGSFTGLRIGASVANALAFANKIPVASVGGEVWINSGIQMILNKETGIAIPEYGAEAHITTPKK